MTLEYDWFSITTRKTCWIAPPGGTGVADGVALGVDDGVGVGVGVADPVGGGADAEGPSTVSQSTRISELPLVPAGHPVERHSCCSTTCFSVSGSVADEPVYDHASAPSMIVVTT